MTEAADATLDRLDDDLRDQLLAIGKGAINVVPLAEFVGAVNPEKRADRIVGTGRAKRLLTLSVGWILLHPTDEYLSLPRRPSRNRV